MHLQGLSIPPHTRLDKQDLLALIKQMGFVQVDSINTVERAHHMILFSRNQTYRPRHLKQLLEEGIQNRFQRYVELARRLRNGLLKIGMPPMTPEDQLNPVLTAAYGPVGVKTSLIVKYLAEAHKIIISGGLGDLKEKTFRIGHMSPIVTENDIDEVLDALKKFKA